MTSPTLKTIALVWDFPEPERANVTPSDATKVHLDAVTSTLRLRADLWTGEYPLDTGLSIAGQRLAPTARTRWRMVQVWATVPTGTTLAYRVRTPTGDLYWTGAAWAAATTQWNTLAELQAGFPSLTAGDIRLVYSMTTTDLYATPEVSRVIVVYEVDVPSWHEEWLFRVLVAALKASVRTTADVVLDWPATGATVTFDPATIEEPPGTGQVIAAAYTAAAPWTDVLSSYNPTTHLVTLTAPATAGDAITLRIQCTPIVAFATHPDYNEVSALPAILLEDIGSGLAGEAAQSTGAGSQATGVAVIVPAPRQLDLAVTLRLVASRTLDLVRLADAVETFVASHPVLSSVATGLSASLTTEATPAASPRTDEANELSTTMRLRLHATEHWISAAEAGYIVLANKFDIRPLTRPQE